MPAVHETEVDLAASPRRESRDRGTYVRDAEAAREAIPGAEGQNRKDAATVRQDRGSAGHGAVAARDGNDRRLVLHDGAQPARELAPPADGIGRGNAHARIEQCRLHATKLFFRRARAEVGDQRDLARAGLTLAVVQRCELAVELELFI